MQKVFVANNSTLPNYIRLSAASFVSQIVVDDFKMSISENDLEFQK